MVISKGKSAFFLFLFLLPAFVVYMLFFVVPFLQGIGISFTNWDGITPKIPNSMLQKDFEDQILSKLDRDDKEYVLSLFRLQDGRYYHQEITGFDRIRVEGLMSSAGYAPPNNRFVGLKNYENILTGKLDSQEFYPRTYTKTYFTERDGLETGLQFKADLFEKKLLDALSGEDAALIDRFFQKTSDGAYYQLKEKYEELGMKEALMKTPGTNSEKMIEFKTDVVRLGLQGQKSQIPERIARIPGFQTLKAEDQVAIGSLADEIYDVGRVKRLLSDHLVENKIKLGVLGFTVFYTVLNVLLTNLVAFLLALALDRKIRSKNLLRSVFFLPNVLSLVIVAYIWSLLFTHFLTPLTGIQNWMSDSDKAPWLIVIVSVWQGAGYLMVIYLAGLQSIPAEILEAASVDGANWWQKLKNVVMPLLLPAFTICLFLSLSNSLKAFDLIFILTNGPTGYTFGTVTYVMDIYFDAFARQAAGLASAKAILLMLVILVVTGIQLTVMKRKEVDY